MKYQSPTGMRDIFDKDLEAFDKIEKAVKNTADFYGFKKIATPMLEQTEIFEKGAGLTSDIVEKEMFSLRTKGGDRLTLRPEITAGVVRAYIQHGMQAMPKPVKLWYFGPCFRHERPQAGRYRQFHQFGFESIGIINPVIDALTIQLAYNILKSLGLKNLMIEVNSIGDSQCRPYYKKSLTSFLRSKQARLCPDCRRRLKKNPLRVLDCKQEKCQKIIESAPQILDHLCKECHDHLKTLLEFLDELELPYNLNPRLVRGLDYYTKTVFEIFQDSEQGEQQGALLAGGRYDDLIKMLGGKNTPACGFASGIERLINLTQIKGKQKQEQPFIQRETYPVFLAQVGQLAKRKSLKLLDEFRMAKIKIGEAIYKDSLSSQLKTADKVKAKYVLILGQKEALDNKVIIREMKTGKQKMVAFNKAVAEIKKKKF